MNYRFYMPNGKVYYKPTAVDRFYNLPSSTTATRLRQGWSTEECARNVRYNTMSGKFCFYMPDGSILTRCSDVDKYYGLCENNTNVRLSKGWTVEECANNKKLHHRYTFHMPDGTELNTQRDVDAYYNLGNGTTCVRLKRGWTMEECANNRKTPKVRIPREKKKVGSKPKYIFTLPNGQKVAGGIALDEALGLRKGTTNQRLNRGWSADECVNNKRLSR